MSRTPGAESRPRASRADPLDRSVRVDLPLPDRHPALHFLDHVTAGGERLVAVRAGDRDRDRCIADLQRADPVPQGDPDGPSRLRSHSRFGRTRLRPSGVGRVLEPRHRAAGVVVAHQCRGSDAMPPRVRRLDLGDECGEVEWGAGEKRHRSAPGQRRQQGHSSPSDERRIERRVSQVHGAKRLGRNPLAPGEAVRGQRVGDRRDRRGSAARTVSSPSRSA